MVVRTPERPRHLSDRILKLLRAEAELCAAEQVDRYRWRGTHNGALPEGHDPASIASHALLQVLQKPNLNNGSKPSQALKRTRQLLRYFVRKEINRLHHRKENRLVRNEPDLALVLNGDDHDSPANLVPDPSPTPTDTIIWDEEANHLDTLKTRFLSFLGNRHKLKTLFRHLCAGDSDPKVLARKLKLNLPVVFSLKRQLRDQIHAFQRRKTCEKVKNDPQKAQEYFVDTQAPA
jgi:hypothetical protein